MRITGRIRVGGEGRPIEEGFRDGYGAPADGTAACFPIIQMREDGPWVPIGTGFFISNNGLFATAKHVLLDKRGKVVEGLAGVHIVRSENRVIVREAIKIVVHAQADVAIGFLVDNERAAGRSPVVNKCFNLTRSLPAVGSKVVTFAFPKTEVHGHRKDFFLKFQTAVASGTIEEYHPDGRDSVMLPGSCFRTSMDIAAGASGGPVAFGDGQVFGINSTGMEGVPVGYISRVEDILGLDAGPVRLPSSGEVRKHASIQDLADVGLVSFL